MTHCLRFWDGSARRSRLGRLYSRAVWQVLRCGEGQEIIACIDHLLHRWLQLYPVIRTAHIPIDSLTTLGLVHFLANRVVRDGIQHPLLAQLALCLLLDGHGRGDLLPKAIRICTRAIPTAFIADSVVETDLAACHGLFTIVPLLLAIFGLIHAKRWHDAGLKTLEPCLRQ